jgi:hypothetical protein
LERIGSSSKTKGVIAIGGVLTVAVTVLQVGEWYATWMTQGLTALPSDVRFLEWFATPFLSAMIAVFIYSILVMAYTLMEFDQNTIRLKQPFKEWMGPWTEVRKAFFLNNGLHLQVSDRIWGLWSIRMDPHAQALLDDIKGRIPSEAWLQEKEARRYIRRKTLLPLAISVSILLLSILILLLVL